jgi:beta-aspartyl-peptidase (threonine type)
MQVIVHGGAGSEPDDPEEHDRGLSRAVEAARAEATPLDAVEAAVRELEAAPAFNAGLGGAIQADGVVRTDAGVMTGGGEPGASPAGGTRSGAACSLPGVKHAVTVARLVRSETPHVLLAGENAVDLAESFDVGAGIDLTTDRTRTRWRNAAPPEERGRERLAWVRERFGAGDDGGSDDGGDGQREADGDGQWEADGDGRRDHDTVGAVVRDGERIAAATSTGGRWFAVPGRVGDVPGVGAGFYASAAAGASATGHGEEIAEDGLARRVVGLIEDGLGAPAATEAAIERFEAATGGTAGVIAVDDEGRVGQAHNAQAMGVATGGR